MSAFKLRRWEVVVPGYGSGIYLTTTRGKALADAWRCDIFGGVKFGEFIRFARCRLHPIMPPRYGDQITVSGKPAFFIGEDGQYVHFAWPDAEFALVSHPLDVEPESYRPRAYRAASAGEAGTAETPKSGSVHEHAVPSEETGDAQ